ncbi:MAG: Patatin [Tardiphaga sp.]|nr:Patatin [Tardiphaga sp.]
MAQTVFVFGGGNALGAYLAGAYEQLSARGIVPDWVIGASAGAITAAIIAGNPPDERLRRLRTFWAEAGSIAPYYPGTEKLRQYSNGWHAALAIMFGRPTIFRHRLPGFWAALPGTPNDIALYDHSPLRATLSRLVDFDRLNKGDVRFSVNCVDIETGDEVVFDNTRDQIKPDHILASAALTPGFPPVTIDGRMLCDPGYVNNTPLDIAFATPPTEDMVIFVLELFCLPSPRPASLDAVLERTQDIMFASSTSRTIKFLKSEYALRAQLDPRLPSIRLLHSVYQTAAHEISMKTLDFSPSSIADRWAIGSADVAGAIEKLAQTESTPGLTYLSASE